MKLHIVYVHVQYSPWDFRWRFSSTNTCIIIYLEKIEKIINLFIPLLFKDFVIFFRDSQISTQIDLPANYSIARIKRVKSYIPCK